MDLRLGQIKFITLSDLDIYCVYAVYNGFMKAFNMRISDSDREKWNEAMKKDGFDTLAAWIRWLIWRHLGTVGQ